LEIKIKDYPEAVYLRDTYDCGYIIELLDKKRIPIEHIRISKTEKLVKSKLFAPSNVLKYYWWHIKQRLFWKNCRNKFGDFLREKGNLNNKPYI